jgi:hypothetical protein
MSKKARKKGRRYRQPVRVPGSGATGVTGTAAAAPTPIRSVSQARIGGDQATVRAVEMSLGARNQVVRGPRGRMVVQSGDPSIPLDRVPYFTRDLVRLLVVGAAMVVLLAVGSFVVPQLVK